VLCLTDTSLYIYIGSIAVCCEHRSITTDCRAVQTTFPNSAPLSTYVLPYNHLVRLRWCWKCCYRTSHLTLLLPGWKWRWAWCSSITRSIYFPIYVRALWFDSCDIQHTCVL